MPQTSSKMAKIPRPYPLKTWNKMPPRCTFVYARNHTASWLWKTSFPSQKWTTFWDNRRVRRITSCSIWDMRHICGSIRLWPQVGRKYWRAEMESSLQACRSTEWRASSHESSKKTMRQPTKYSWRDCWDYSISSWGWDCTSLLILYCKQASKWSHLLTSLSLTTTGAPNYLNPICQKRKTKTSSFFWCVSSTSSLGSVDFSASMTCCWPSIGMKTMTRRRSKRLGISQWMSLNQACKTR